MRRFRLLSITVLLFASCGKPLPALEGIDQKQWKNDKNGCSRQRIAMTSAIRSAKRQLLSLNELEIVSLLGKPDRNELFKRNQKFYYYFLEPAPECDSTSKTPLKLIIRFNAMGLAKEALVE